MESKNDNLIGRILSSVFYKSSTGKAGKMLQNPKGLLDLLKSVLTKANDGSAGGVLGSIKNKFITLVSLVKAYATGEYRDISRTSVLAVVAALVYFLSPIDLIPDFIPMFGFADDIALLTFVFGRIREEIEKFELWEMNKDLNR